MRLSLTLIYLDRISYLNFHKIRLFYFTDPNQRFSDIKRKRESIEPIRQKWAKDRQFNNSLDEFKSKIVPISLREKKGPF